MDRIEDRESLEINRRYFLAASAASVGVLMNAQAQAVESEAALALDEIRRFDVVVVGGGPAGLSAALVLGRACLKVLLCDAGPGRNAPAEGVHGFLGQDGTPPSELRRVGLEQLKPYDVACEAAEVVEARKTGQGFELVLGNGGRVECRKLILATGVKDILPEIPGFRELWGGGVIHCPYCHGWEFRGRPWAFMAPEESVEEVAGLILGWTKTLTLVTNGPAVSKPELRDWLARHSIGVIEDRIDRLEGEGKRLDAIHFEGGRRLEVGTLFAGLKNRQRSPLAEKLGCEFITEGRIAGLVKTDAFGATSVESLHVVGDASSVGVQSVASAVAEGSIAAAMASRSLIMAAAAH